MAGGRFSCEADGGGVGVVVVVVVVVEAGGDADADDAEDEPKMARCKRGEPSSVLCSLVGVGGDSVWLPTPPEPEKKTE